MRPRGTHGEVARAMLEVAAQSPGTVVELAHQARVSVPVARYTASRLVDRGHMVVLHAGRPAVLAAATPDNDKTQAQADHLMVLHGLWWGAQAA